MFFFDSRPKVYSGTAPYDGSRWVYYEGQDYNTFANNTRIVYPTSYVVVHRIPMFEQNPYLIPGEIETYPVGRGVNPIKVDVSYYLPIVAVPWYHELVLGIAYSPNQVSEDDTIVARENSYTFFTSPIDLYLNFFGYGPVNPDVMMVPGQTNTLEIRAISNSYHFKPRNSISTVHYLFYGYAPYGDVFPKLSQNDACYYNLEYYYKLGKKVESDTLIVKVCDDTSRVLSLSADGLKPDEYALDDALVRLFERLGALPLEAGQGIPGSESNPILIKLNNARIVGVGVSDIPSTLEQVKIIVRLWRGDEG